MMLSNRRMLNLTGLVLGYLLGQGSFLIASFVILSQEKYELATAIGYSMSIVTLLFMVMDMGGQIYLARQQALADDGQDVDLRTSLAGIIVLRLLTWLGLCALCLGAGDMLGLYPDPLSKAFVTMTILGLFVWSFNQTGLLDGRKLQGIAGLTIALPWLMTSIVAIMGSLSNHSLTELGQSLGVTFVVGALVAVLVQALVLRSSPLSALGSFSMTALRQAIHIGGGVFLAQLPGQLTGRVQIFFAVLLFPPELSAAFILSRNILNASNNIINMARRIEFPNLVALLGRGVPSLNRLLKHQNLSFICTGLIGVLYVVGGLAACSGWLPGFLQGSAEALQVTMWFLPVLFATALSGALTQALLALGRPAMLVVSSIVSLAVSSLLTYLLVYTYGFPAMVIASFTANLTITAIMVISLSKYRNEQS